MELQSKSIRLLRRGDVIEAEGVEEVVRDVSVVVQFASGITQTYAPSESVEVIPPEDLGDLPQQIQQIQESDSEG